MPIRLCLPCLLVLSSGLSALRADEKWTELLANDRLDAFKGKTDGWVFAESVKLDDKNPKKLAFTGGKGIVVNGQNGRATDLVTKDAYGDVEIHVEFLISKGSNSGVKFHAQYEIQILDSFGKQKLTGDDCGGIYPRAEILPKYRYLDDGVPPKVNACKPA